MFGVIGAVCGAVATAISGVLTSVGGIFISIANAITVLANILGLTKTEKAENLGDKIIQAEDEGISPEHYESYAAYIKAIDDFEVDEEKSKAISQEEKIKKGLDASAKVLEEKFPDNDITGLLTSATVSPENQEYFSSDRFKEIAKEIEKNPDLIDSLSKILNGKEIAEDEYYDVMDKMTAIEQRLHPEQTKSEISDYLQSLG
jgi:hypothetical protein